MDFEFIDESDIEAVSRGRKSNVSPELVEAFAKLPVGKAIKVASLAGDTSDIEGYKAHKATASATLRSAGKQAGVTVRIAWSPAGVPQVSVIKSGKAKKA